MSYVCTYPPIREVGLTSYEPPLIEPEIAGLGIGAKLTDQGDFSALNDAGFWNGRLDDAGIWNRALSADEVRGIYVAGLDGMDLTQAVPVEPPPDVELTISLGAGQVAISWPADAAGFNLQSATNVSSGEWNNVDTEPIVDGDVQTVTVDITEFLQIFRLLRP